MIDAGQTARTFKTAWFAKAARKALIDDAELCRPSRKCEKAKPTISAGVCSRSA
jgi:hypothetical protein